jgi:hypothetical protein
MWQGGNQWSGWAAYLSFFRHVAQISLDYTKWDAYEQLSTVGIRVMHQEFCLIAERPIHLEVDAERRPHRATGPFSAWPDGSGFYAWHGTRVPGWLIEHPERITVQHIHTEQNVEVRRVMLERFGMDRFVRESAAMPVDADNCGTLYRIELPNDEPIVLVSVLNSTVEPDGTSKRYVLRVPPTMATASEAVAWTFGMTAADYRPAIES